MDANTSSRSTAEQTDARTLGQRLANPQFGTLVLRERQRHTWSENAHEFRLTPWSNDPVSDPNTEAYYLRDEETGHFWSPTLLPSGGADAVCDAPRLRLQRVRAQRGRHRLRAHRVRGDRRAGQVRGAEACATLGSRTPAFRHRLRRMGARRRAREDGDARGAPKSTRAPARCSRAMPYNTEFAGRVAFFDVDDSDAYRVRRSRRVPRTQRHAARPGRHARDAAFRQRRRRAGSVRGTSGPLDLADGQTTRVRLPARRRRTTTSRRANSCSAGAASAAAQRCARGGQALLAAHAGRRAGRNARPVARRAGQRLAGLPDAGVPPVGAQRRSTSRAARSASAISCRT